MPPAPLRLGNAQAFWGDDPDAPARLVRQQPDLDFLTLDYLAEVSLSIMAGQRAKDPRLGYARDFIEVLRSLVPAWRSGSKLRIVSNAGGLNPRACAEACRQVLREAGLDRLKLAVVCGDDVLPVLKTGAADAFANLETGEPLSLITDRLTTANAYLGATGIAEALRAGADIVVTGRVADPSMAVGPCLAHFGWANDDYHRIAGATIAGHMIECGTQATGGFSTDWLELPGSASIGYPVVEVAEDGSCVVTKPAGTGGQVNVQNVKEQLLYEIGDPGNYLSPDATVSLLGLEVREIAPDRVLIRGATGRPPTPSYKVSATYADGYKAHAMITIFGRDAVAKARRCGEDVLARLSGEGVTFERTLIECLGSGASVAGVDLPANSEALLETVLRLSVADANRASVERFTKMIAPLVTCGPQGVTGYSGGRAKVQSVFGYWPCLVPKSAVEEQMCILDPAT